MCDQYDKKEAADLIKFLIEKVLEIYEILHYRYNYKKSIFY